MSAWQTTVGAAHVTGAAQALLRQMLEQHALLELHAAPSPPHMGGCVLQTPETHALPPQQSVALAQGAPAMPHAAPASKSLVTFAPAFGCKTTVTLTIAPALSVAGVGSLTQLGTVVGVTAEQSPEKACSVKFTFPTGRLFIVSWAGWPAMRLNDCVTVRLPVTVIWRHVPSGGTVAISIDTLPVSSLPGVVEADEQPMPAKTAHTADA
jgi:hypothetical protein